MTSDTPLPLRTRKLVDDCFLHDSDRLRHDEAIALLRERVSAVAENESVALEEAAGRILAEPVIAPRNVPLTDNSAMDGYAFAHGAYDATGGFFPIDQRIPAGHPAPEPLLPGRAARIFTGAVMPVGADTVAMQEDCETHEQDDAPFVIIPPGLKKGANVRLAGEDVAEGAELIPAGSRLRPQEIAAIASIGQDRVTVARKLKVAILSTGDEIVRPGAPIAPGQVYDSNVYLLRALLESVGVEVTDLGVLPDEPETIRATIRKASETHQAILSSGGASRGEEDHLVAALDALGTRHMWQLAIKPGRPMNFGQIDDCIMLGLPGNPVAAMVCFLFYVRPVLVAMSGAPWPEPVRLPLPAAFEIKKKKTGRREFSRGWLTRDDEGRLVVDKFERDGSGLITGLREADGLIEIAEDTTGIKRGDIVSFIPFTEFGLPGK
ncbi:gephyrin-like molybdotransferase Glp [Breoghania sp.]|uniref:molybdopterin molybdotransferase MoeA n=1 Tax=Breoghania sp. TaxID=2065378 RepID=UPI002AAA7C17|nr:gephyrin-like molybdotransferase Glp [Breoghania sp.]